MATNLQNLPGDRNRCCEYSSISPGLLTVEVFAQFESVYRLLLLITLVLVPSSTGLATEDHFRAVVVPILRERCLRCHNSVERKGGFSVQDAQDFLTTVSGDDPEASQLLDVITPTGGEARMPKDAEPLLSAELAAIRQWLAAGAVWPRGFVIDERSVDDFDWWSFRPIRLAEVPAVDDAWVRNPVDAFVLRRLREKGLTYSGEADRRVLVRRLFFDLTGLPPTPADVDEFLNDQAPDAYERLVERLLDSKHYGERWARHWLDVVKYADTCGYDKDKLRANAWPYRDYVIRSLNLDKPFWRFVQEQVAGDVLFPGDQDGILGLGFIAAGPWDFIGHVEVSETKIDGKVARNLDRDDMISNTLNTFCSLTVQCARCHNHKFDPITQEHYYGLQSIFAAVDRAERPYNLTQEVAEKRLQAAADLKTAGDALQAIERELEKSTAATDEQVRQREQAEETVRTAEAKLRSLPRAEMVYAAATHFPTQGNFKPTLGKLRPIHILRRGNIQEPLTAAIPGLLPLDTEDRWTIDPADTDADRRAALAQWLTSPDHPLVWRSIVNRVWQYHFGRGLVNTPNDFGRMGAEPTHPHLLDWLAATFRDGEQSLKQLHRLIVTSSTYRQSSLNNAANAAIDSENQYLWRMRRRRLTAEEVRDSILAVSGALDTTMGGPGYYLFALEKTEHSPHYEYHKFDPADPASHRRSIYRFIVRSQPDPWMTTLDCADSSQSTPIRNETLTPLQALSLLNNPLSLYMAERFAARLKSEAPDVPGQVARGVMLATQRPATPSELRELTAYANAHGLENMCRFLFNLSEFVFVD